MVYIRPGGIMGIDYFGIGEWKGDNMRANKLQSG